MRARRGGWHSCAAAVGLVAAQARGPRHGEGLAERPLYLRRAAAPKPDRLDPHQRKGFVIVVTAAAACAAI
eukprot:COSAG01_NODE_15635_length_1316_cov_9.824158_1_plen_70_part_10